MIVDRIKKGIRHSINHAKDEGYMAYGVAGAVIKRALPKTPADFLDDANSFLYEGYHKADAYKTLQKAIDMSMYDARKASDLLREVNPYMM